ncbi:SCO family protein [Leptospira levettii]|uniref:SCO family protein n=1 Tax=Leptospira levettii TaxID=2023178 RepID=UPI001EEBA0DD|nr:SCO family protein [Leptospira levettii]MCG6148288.1 SCO family protein [Leptospira levettii]
MNQTISKYFYSYLFVIVGISLFQCDEHNTNHHHEHEPLLAANEPAQGSILELKNQWKNEENKTVSFVDWKGKPFLISMFYASCISICPRLVSDLEQVAKKIESESGKVPNVILVSFDSKNDTPQVLKDYKKKMGLGQNWSLLTGKEEDVRILSVILGINYKKMESGEFNHSAVISLFDREGLNVTRIEGIGSNVETMILKFKELK